MNNTRKYIYFLVCTVLIVIALSTTTVSGEEIIKGVVIGSDVNVRKEANIESTVISVLKLGDYVTISDSIDEWYIISLNDGQTGYVYSDLVLPINSETDLIKKGFVNTDNLNLREQPDTGSRILSRLHNGTEITITEESGDWYRVKTADDQRGWVHSDFVIMKSNFSTGQITGNNVNVRSKPSLASDIITKLSMESYVSIKDYQDGWYNVVTADELEGWISQEFVTVILGKNADRAEVSRSSSGRVASILKVVDYAKKYLGTPYKWASSGPKSFDCSGFTTYTFKQFGIKLPRTSVDQSKTGEKIAKDNLDIGDLVFFDTSGANNGRVTHVGIYIGKGEFIHASSGKNAKKVVISSLDEGYYNDKYVTARRVL